MRILKIVCFSFIIFLSNQGKSQAISIDSIQACIGDTADISINIPVIDSAGAITLFIGYDTTKLKFINLININPLANGLIFNDMHSGVSGALLGKIAISWVAGFSGVNFNTGIFATLNFKVMSSNCPVTFINNCEIVNYNAQIISVLYSNGFIMIPSLPLITAQPVQLSLNSSQNGFFSVDALNTDSIQWQINQGNGWINLQNNSTFQGINNDTLYVLTPGPALNGAFLRCLVGNLCQSILSDSVILNVTGLNIHENGIKNIKVYPNPFDDFLSIELLNQDFIDVIYIYQSDGKLVKQLTNPYKSALLINKLNNLENGIYFIEVISENNERMISKSRYKLMKN